MQFLLPALVQAAGVADAEEDEAARTEWLDALQQPKASISVPSFPSNRIIHNRITLL